MAVWPPMRLAPTRAEDPAIAEFTNVEAAFNWPTGGCAIVSQQGGHSCLPKSEVS
jgi:hypothetical protein